MEAKEVIVLEMKEVDEVSSDPNLRGTDLLIRVVITLQKNASDLWNGTLVKKITGAILVVLYFVYFGFAISNG